MKNIYLFFILLISFGCQPDLTNQQSAETQFYRIDLNKTETVQVECEQGTKIQINPEDLVFENGTPAGGILELEIKEYYQPFDMIMDGISTVSNRRLLETGGMLYIKATVNGLPVKLKGNTKYEVQFTSIAKEEMQSFYGEETEQGLNWVVGNADVPAQVNESEGAVIFSDSLDPIKEYRHHNIQTFNRFKWINCDRFLEFDKLTDLKVECKNIDQCYLIFGNYNSIMSGFSYENSESLDFINLPIGEPVKLVVMDHKKTKYYSKDFVISENQVFNIKLRETDFDVLEKEINELFEK